MANGYEAPGGDDLEELRSRLRRLAERLSELERPTGTSISSLVSQVQAKLAELDATVETLVSTYSYTKAQIDSKVASPGNIAPGNVTASGDVGVGGALRAMSVYNTTLTTSYRAVWSTSVDGQLGYVPSSERFKQDIEALSVNVAVLLELQVVEFKYIAAVEEFGDAAAVEVSFIAERVHELGLFWLVDYDEDGLPFGIRYERIGMAALLVAQWNAAQHALLAEAHLELSAEVAAIKSSLGL